MAEVLWRKIDSFEPETQFDQWAFGVARNKVLNFQKKKARERVKFSDSFEELLATEAATHARIIGGLMEALESCVEKLPSQHRELLRRRYEPEATSRSVAEVLGRSESAISRTLNKIYGLLMSCIDSDAKTRTSQ